MIDVANEPLALHPRVALRPEPFGALAYHYDTRRLNFLRSHELVAVVRALGDHPTPRAAFDAVGVDPRRWPAFEQAINALTESGFLRARASGGLPPEQPPDGAEERR